MIYAREVIPTKELNFLNFPDDIETIFEEINLINHKWLLFRCYHPQG